MNFREFSDSELIYSLRAGEKKAFDYIYNKYSGLVYSIAFKILQNNADAEEIAQDIFISLWQKDNYNPDRASLKTFLALLTRSRALDRLRKGSRSSAFLEQNQKNLYETNSEQSPLETLETKHQQELLQNALTQLPIEQKTILILNYFEGLSRSQIAEKLNLPVGTVKSRVRLAFVQLKRILAAQTNQ